MSTNDVSLYTSREQALFDTEEQVVDRLPGAVQESLEFSMLWKLFMANSVEAAPYFCWRGEDLQRRGFALYPLGSDQERQHLRAFGAGVSR